MRRLGIFVAAAVLMASPAHADASSASGFLQLAKTPEGRQLALIYLKGMIGGFGWANAETKDEAKYQMYCQPENLALADEQALDILARAVEEQPGLGKHPAGLVLLMALKKVFPCPAT